MDMKQVRDTVSVDGCPGVSLADMHKDPVEGTDVFERIPALRLFGHDSRTRMMAICAEPGMGSSDALTAILDRVGSDFDDIKRLSFAHLDPSDAAGRIVLAARRMSRLTRAVIVVLDDLPASDELCSRRIARALRRLWESRVPVLLSVPPEGRHLLELVPECSVIGSLDLLLPDVLAARFGSVQAEIRDLTYGIPSLVASLGGFEFGSQRPFSYVPYRDRLSSLIGLSLRLTLSDEEIRLRMAMVMLGHGTASDLQAAVRDVSPDVMGVIREYAPHFGVSERLDSFSCVLGDSPVLLDLACARLEALCPLFPDLAPACVRILIDRGEFDKVALALPLCGQTDVARDLAVKGGVGLAIAGHPDLVCEHLLGTDCPSLTREDFKASSPLVKALCALSCPALPRLSRLCDEGFLTKEAGNRRDALLLADARQILMAKELCSAVPEEGWTECGRMLLAHRKVADLMREGRFESATEVLLANPVPKGDMSVPSALLLVDAELARLFLCDAACGSVDQLEEARRVLESPALRGLSGYASLIDLACTLLGQKPAEEADLEGVLSRAERRGDSLVQIVALLVGCVLDLRGRAYARANVRALLAGSVARASRFSYLERLAALSGEVACFLMGERSVEENVLECGADSLGRVWRLVRMAMASEDDALVAVGESREGTPREALWLLALLGEGMGELSALVAKEMPASWSQALALLDVGKGEMSNVLSQASTHVGGTDRGTQGQSDERPVRICLLGGCTVSVKGVCIDEARLGRRKVIPLLEYLALQEGASVPRHRVVEQVWPDCDYAMGYNKIYQATSLLRATFEAMGEKDVPFVSSRASKTMGLNMNVVSCDVDDFIECARMATDTIDDVTAVEMARRVEGLYRGDLHVSGPDATGFVSAAKERLRVLYADAMVAGADAALRLGKRKTATRLATNATIADERREDAVVSLVQALRASGRVVEAEQHYRRYARRLAQTSERPPSRALRRAAGKGDESSHRPEARRADDIAV